MTGVQTCALPILFKKGGIVLVTQKGCSVDKTVQAVHTSGNIVRRWMQELEQETSSECLKAKERAS